MIRRVIIFSSLMSYPRPPFRPKVFFSALLAITNLEHDEANVIVGV